MNASRIVVRHSHAGAVLFVAIVLGMATATAAVTVNLAKGKPVTGDVIEKTDSNIVIKTATGLRTIAWRDVTVTTLKTLHPELYARLKEKAGQRARLKAEAEKKVEEAMLAEGKVKVGGKWIGKEEAQLNLLRRMRINIATREQTKVADSHKDSSLQYSREKDTTLQCWGEVAFKIDGLEPVNTYTFAINLTHYCRGTGHSTHVGQRYSPKTDVAQEIAVTGVSATNIILKTPAYERTKHANFSTYGGSSKAEYGGKTDGYDITITVDGTLVYDQKKGVGPKYYYIGGR